MSAAVIEAQRTKVRVELQGCYVCGDAFSSGWHEGPEVLIKAWVDGRARKPLRLRLPVCDPCVDKALFTIPPQSADFKKEARRG